ncbi:organic cation transporter-like protein [Hydractinia symbiolongicarpus]|uniref:organic cation transporter-like protein n=1 Tax=Hydractinia symbiolongicarpus TaxID=13093 RepID=UPI00254B826C|nr:organic cation transporter-like protein [Hydractinia symbiolongicarpus]
MAQFDEKESKLEGVTRMTEKGTGKEGQLDDVLLKLGSPGRYHVICYLLLWCCNAFVAFNHVSLPSTFGITPSYRSTSYPGFFYVYDILTGWFRNNPDSYGKKIGCALQNGRPNTISLKKNTHLPQKVNVFLTYKPKAFFGKHKIFGVSTFVIACRYVDLAMRPNGKKIKIISFSDICAWNLVCDNNFYPMVSTTVYFIGVMIGGGTIGRVSDRYGRRPVLLISLGLAIIFFAVASLIKNIIRFTLLRFFGGIFACGVHSIVYVMTPELAPKKHNNYLSLLLIFSFLTSVAAGGGICWATKSWWQSQLYTSLSLVIPLCLMYFFLPESFRWLVVHKKYKLLNQYLTKAAKMNNVTLLSLSVIHSGETIKGVKPINRKRISTKKLFSYKELRRRLLAMFFAWTSAAIGYYTLSLSMESVSSDPYLAVMIGACFDTVPVVIAFFTLNSSTVSRENVFRSNIWLGIRLLCGPLPYYRSKIDNLKISLNLALFSERQFLKI